jgi:predicted phosphodiesterase
MTMMTWVVALLASFVWADTELAVIGDAGRANSNTRTVMASLQRAGVTRLVLPGDNLYSGTYSQVWDSWRTAGFTFDAVAIGNHHGGYAEEMRYFGMPSEYHSRVIGGARFLILNSDNDRSAAAQATWLDQELTAATESLVFLVFHHPSYSVSRFHRWEEKPNFQRAIRPVFWRHRSKITALLVGHDHLATLIRFDDLPVILSGAVQEVRRDSPVDNLQEGVSVKTDWYFDDNPYWANLKIADDLSQATVDYVRARDDYRACTAILRTGREAELQPNCRVEAPAITPEPNNASHPKPST